MFHMTHGYDVYLGHSYLLKFLSGFRKVALSHLHRERDRLFFTITNLEGFYKSKICFQSAILLGHLKMSVTEVVQALYRMDEGTLSPELIEQLLTYAPSKREVSSLCKIKLI